jgi:hypothetical protein
VLLLIPKTVDRTPLSLSFLEKQVNASHKKFGGLLSIQRSILDQLGNSAIENSHWILMTKDVLPGSRNKNYAAQKQLVENAGYEVPTCLDATTAILLEYVRS